MIKMLRIDERLIHGQVAVVWSKVLHITHILVANDDVMNNDTQQMSMKMAVPDNIKFLCRNVSDSINLLKKPQAQQLAMFVVVQNFKDAKKIGQELQKQIEVINVGNYGLLPINQHGTQQRKIDSAVQVDEADLSEIKAIAQLAPNFVSQLTPDAKTKNLKKIYGGE
ncbi:PTS mannose/fructose/sorbose transporter subunit IIB [Bombilactobacillus bombi]|uniref:PTS mannose/fructose/sorbose transporter subunit IIB n=1 Tax=Bombilactobacillus bombi TaxID=1303590 RepID=A0A417ZJJ4_9LACO|nr:PTS sugar transporter subunit IIB [Bombilactobacillus bombi]RHW52046.1 PTS mannose/fructose/sorbose transporter subunit IIB [Bombilactobacillus bombi]